MTYIVDQPNGSVNIEDLTIDGVPEGCADETGKESVEITTDSNQDDEEGTLDNSTFPCQICGFKLKDQTSLDIHIKRHQDIRRKCKECGETFKMDKDLEFHITYEHRKITQYNCMNCSFQATSKDQLQTHMNFKHTKEAEREVFDCETCKRQFRSNWHRKNHQRDDHGKDQEGTFYKEKRCKFGNTCWKTHNENRGAITFTCYSCKEIF